MWVFLGWKNNIWEVRKLLWEDPMYLWTLTNLRIRFISIIMRYDWDFAIAAQARRKWWDYFTLSSSKLLLQLKTVLMILTLTCGCHLDSFTFKLLFEKGYLCFEWSAQKTSYGDRTHMRPSYHETFFNLPRAWKIPRLRKY